MTQTKLPTPVNVGPYARPSSPEPEEEVNTTPVQPLLQPTATAQNPPRVIKPKICNCCERESRRRAMIGMDDFYKPFFIVTIFLLLVSLFLPAWAHAFHAEPQATPSPIQNDSALVISQHEVVQISDILTQFCIVNRTMHNQIPDILPLLNNISSTLQEAVVAPQNMSSSGNSTTRSPQVTPSDDLEEMIFYGLVSIVSLIALGGSLFYLADTVSFDELPFRNTWVFMLGGIVMALGPIIISGGLQVYRLHFCLLWLLWSAYGGFVIGLADAYIKHKPLSPCPKHGEEIV